MESIMRDEIVDHLVTYQLIISSQYGFMSNKSCTTNLLEFLETITKCFDAGEPMDLIYLDFSKAFDKVPHKRLLRKMESLGIKGNILRWVKAWLTNRRQCTVLNGSSSGWADVLSGVPQGSVLGPLLYVIFINDLDDCTRLISTMQKFADDTKLGNVAASLQDCQVLQDSIDKLVGWADTWGMQFNVKKCKANAVLTQISRAFQYRDRRVFLQLYKQFVRCHLEFSTPAWSLWQTGDIQLLEQVQRRAVRLINGLQGVTYEERLAELGLRTLEERRIRIDLVQTCKILNGYDKVDCKTWFNIVGNHALRATRSTGYHKNIIGNRANTEIRRHFFSNRVVAQWNSLPEYVKDSPTVHVFKNRLDKTVI